MCYISLPIPMHVSMIMSIFIYIYIHIYIYTWADPLTTTPTKCTGYHATVFPYMLQTMLRVFVLANALHNTSIASRLQPRFCSTRSHAARKPYQNHTSGNRTSEEVVHVPLLLLPLLLFPEKPSKNIENNKKNKKNKKNNTEQRIRGLPILRALILLPLLLLPLLLPLLVLLQKPSRNIENNKKKQM